ncbi:ferredoxin reductase [Nonomuraea sp. NPDC048826]|uniref:ferredoxin reductase n=1 Tax=Nonomuraea sp. NPDC048826 TaxID=3364347 RepID=UPI003719D5AA
MRRLTWLAATLAEIRPETPTARTLVFDVPGWPGHLAGQHVDVRLTAEDGYRAQRSYSIAAPVDGDRVELTVEEVPDGEVSPYLVEVIEPGDRVELRGPVGGWFVWRPENPAPVLLVAGGSGIVPLMAMVRERRRTAGRTPFRLLYSLRDPGRRYYADELRRPDPGLDVTYLYTRSAPENWPRKAGRIVLDDLAVGGWPPDFEPEVYVCGPTGFVEAAADLLLALGHAPHRIRTERFGPSGG